MSRRLALLLLIVLAVPAIALAADTDPKKQINPVDQRTAASLVLKRSDFIAGWKKQPNTPDKNADYTCPGYNPDQSDLVLTGEVEASFAPAEGFPMVSSTSNVYKTRREAVAAWTRGDRPALVPCAAKILKEEIEKDGGKVTVVKQGRLAFPKLAPRTSAYRIGLNVTVSSGGKQTTVPVTVHLIFLGHGRGDVMLVAVSFGNSATLAGLRGFATLIASRLEAAKL